MFSNIKKLIFVFLLCLSWGAQATNIDIDLTGGASAITGQINLGADVDDWWNFSSTQSGEFELTIQADTASILFGLEDMAVNGVVGDVYSFSSNAIINESFHISGISKGYLGGGYAVEYTFTATESPAASPVPVPGVVWLLSSAMLGLVAISRRKYAKVS